MKTEDARTLPAQVQEEKRKQAIRLYKRNHQYKEIASLVGVHFETIGKWVRAYRAQGREGIVSKKHGRKPGSGRVLNTEQAQSIQRLIIDKRPDQLKMTYALWTRKAVKELIEREVGYKNCWQLSFSMGLYATEAA